MALAIPPGGQQPRRPEVQPRPEHFLPYRWDGSFLHFPLGFFLPLLPQVASTPSEGHLLFTYANVPTVFIVICPGREKLKGDLATSALSFVY